MIDLVLTVVVAVLGCALLLTVVVIWSIKRHRDPRLRIETDAPLAELLPSLSGLTHGAAFKGNAIEILENGAFFEVLFEETGRAGTDCLPIACSRSPEQDLGRLLQRAPAKAA
jgi:cardiolipin synthase